MSESDSELTRPSLLKRLKNRDDLGAREEFCRRYGQLLDRLVWSFVKKQGIRHQDVNDLQNESFVHILQKLEDFNYDEKRGGFRKWLICITCNRIRDVARKPNAAVGSGQTDFHKWLGEQPDYKLEKCVDSHLSFEVIEILEAAGERLRGEISDRDWKIFKATVIEPLTAGKSRSTSEISDDIGISVDVLYKTKSRHLPTFRKYVMDFDNPNG